MKGKMLNELFCFRLRPIIIDGSNVSISHGQIHGLPGPTPFSCRGLDICINYFIRRGHPEVIAVVPHHRLKIGQAFNQEILQRYENSKHLMLTPSRTIPGEGSFSSYDDRFVIKKYLSRVFLSTSFIRTL